MLVWRGERCESEPSLGDGLHAHRWVVGSAADCDEQVGVKDACWRLAFPSLATFYFWTRSTTIEPSQASSFFRTIKSPKRPIVRG